MSNRTGGFRRSRLLSFRKNTSRERRSGYWKYHIIQFGYTNLYLTTLPDEAHIGNVTYAPSLYAQIIPLPGTPRGFRMVVKLNVSESEPLFVMTFFQGNWKLEIKQCFQGKEPYGLQPATMPSGITLANNSEEIPLKELNQYEIVDRDEVLAKTVFLRYRIAFSSNDNWLVGSLPHVREAKRNLILKDSQPKKYHLQKKHDIYFYKPSNEHGKCENKILGVFRENTKYTEKFKKRVSRNLQEAPPFGDGLSLENPQDDIPHRSTLGWITVYHDDTTLSKIDNDNGVKFLTVLAYTLGVSYQKLSAERAAK